MGQPAARVGDPHVCPMFDGPKPHVGGPVLPPGKLTVLIGGMPAATITDYCACASVPDIIMEGAATVLINGLPAARQFDKTVHGGMIMMGCPTVLIGGPSFIDNSLLQYRPAEVKEEKPSLIGQLFRAVVIIVAAGVAMFGSGIAAGIAEIVNWGLGIYEAVSGKDFITGEKLELWERVLAVSPLGAAGRKVVKGAAVGIRNVFRGATKIEKSEALVAKTTKLEGLKHTVDDAPKIDWNKGPVIRGVDAEKIVEGKYYKDFDNMNDLSNTKNFPTIDLKNEATKTVVSVKSTQAKKVSYSSYMKNAEKMNKEYPEYAKKQHITVPADYDISQFDRLRKDAWDEYGVEVIITRD